MAEGEVRLEALTKHFDDVVAVDGIDVEMPPGEFFTLLGPSGCGKTTTLRMIAGFEEPSSGRIMLDDVDVARVAPHKRSVNTVFQSYALFPHLDVARNIAFGLKYKQGPKDDRQRRIADVLKLVRLEGFERRKPDQLSGGQQQRVALARALVLQPRVLLLDEPLGALDARLRKELQVELKALQNDVGITFVFVTHDQDEALTMSDRIAVMNDGRIEQAGSPHEVYEEPHSDFVADFLGVSNLLSAEALGDGALKVGERTLRADRGETSARGPVRAMIRPERIAVEPHGSEGDNRLAGMIEQSVFHGGTYEVHVRVVGGDLLRATIPNDGRAIGELAEGTPVSLGLPREALRILAPSSQGTGEDDSAAAAADRPVRTAPSI